MVYQTLRHEVDGVLTKGERVRRPICERQAAILLANMVSRRYVLRRLFRA
jgi:hypothetical protein